MSDDVCVLLSQKGESLKVFMRKDFLSDYEEISGTSKLTKFEDLWVVKEHRDLLEQLISSHDPLTNLTALRKIQTKIELESSSASQKPQRGHSYNYSNLNFLTKENKLKTSFTFLHEQTTVHPGHKMATVYISGISGLSSAPYNAHDEKLEDLIQFIDEHCFSTYKEESRRSFVKGFEYAKTSWLSPTWIRDYLCETQGEDFNKGKNAAKFSL